MSERTAGMRIAVHHGSTGAAGKAASLDRLMELAATARGLGAALLVLPQLFLGGRPADLAAARRQGELSDGPCARRIGGIARAHGLGLLCGYVELCTGHLYDAALFVDERGRAVANYRRTHLLPDQDGNLFAHGQWLTMVPFQGRKLGLLIGIDVDGPEQARALALAGADLLLVAGGHRAGTPVAALLPARAAENGCGLAFANAAGGADDPASCLIGPDGRVLAATVETLAVADVPMAAPERALARDLARRPRLYQRLVAPLPGEDAPRL